MSNLKKLSGLLGGSTRKIGQGIEDSLEEEQVFKILNDAVSKTFKDKIKDLDDNTLKSISRTFYKCYQNLAQLDDYKEIPSSVREYFQRRYGH